jgi:hypothetical protein
MQFSVHYNPKLARLVSEGHLKLDRFKCPAWPDLIEEARAVAPVYVHFPLVVGHPEGFVYDTERKTAVDWSIFEPLLQDTPYLNLHVLPFREWYSSMPTITRDPIHIEMIMDNVIRGVEDAVSHVGADRVILENVNGPLVMQAAFSPSFIRQVVHETSTGFLLDISHARLAAEEFCVDIENYMAGLPLDRVREAHITGIQPLEGEWLDTARSLNLFLAHAHEGQRIDHLPMTDDDWAFFDWSLDQIQSGNWSTPWMMAYEYGGVGGLWEVIADETVYRDQVPVFQEKIAAVHLPV